MSSPGQDAPRDNPAEVAREALHSLVNYLQGDAWVKRNPQSNRGGRKKAPRQQPALHNTGDFNPFGSSSSSSSSNIASLAKPSSSSVLMPPQTIAVSSGIPHGASPVVNTGMPLNPGDFTQLGRSSSLVQVGQHHFPSVHYDPISSLVMRHSRDAFVPCTPDPTPPGAMLGATQVFATSPPLPISVMPPNLVPSMALPPPSPSPPIFVTANRTSILPQAVKSVQRGSSLPAKSVLLARSTPSTKKSELAKKRPVTTVCIAPPQQIDICSPAAPILNVPPGRSASSTASLQPKVTHSSVPTDPLSLAISALPEPSSPTGVPHRSSYPPLHIASGTSDDTVTPLAQSTWPSNLHITPPESPMNTGNILQSWQDTDDGSEDLFNDIAHAISAALNSASSSSTPPPEDDIHEDLPQQL